MLQVCGSWHIGCNGLKPFSDIVPIEIEGDSQMKDVRPCDYWETCDARQGGVIADINENGLCVHSIVDMRIGGELRIRVFYSLGNGFDGFNVLAKIVGKDLCCSEGWETYKYDLEFSEISEPDRQKLSHFLGIRETRNIYS